MQHSKKVLLFTISILLLPALSFGLEADHYNASAHYNLVLISLVSLMAVLLMIIGVLSLVVKQLGIVVKDKALAEKGSGSAVTKAILLLVALLPAAAASFAADEQVSGPVGPQFISGIPEWDFYIVVGMIGLELCVIFSQVINLSLLLKAIKKEPELIAKMVEKKSWFWDKFNKAASIEKEKDILLDHNYDGIQELDNSLPPWWIYGFYVTIIVSFIYIYRFHISHDGLSQQDEYITEMQQGEDDKAAYLAQSANKVDETNVVLLTEAGQLAEGKDLFIKNCAACHLADGGGTVGPNLTDQYWLHGGSIKDIFKSIKYGWQDKGMKSWKDDFSPKQIQLLASFVNTLKGTHPATPKAQQGELYIEAGAVTDSNSVKADSTTQPHVAAK